jgi:hypothetical protein
VQVKAAVDKTNLTIHMNYWRNLANNNFTFAKEVTQRGGHERLPTSSYTLTASRWACWNSSGNSTFIDDGIYPHLYPNFRIQRLVLQHGEIYLGRERFRQAVLWHDWYRMEVIPHLERGRRE